MPPKGSDTRHSNRHQPQRLESLKMANTGYDVVVDVDDDVSEPNHPYTTTLS